MIPVKQLIKQSGIRQWQIAEHIGIRETEFSKRLRYEPDAVFRAQILTAIEQIQAKRQ